jgi:diguanylate cyclase (GGDEF)-like protein/PAS domain S-box-containing protein
MNNQRNTPQSHSRAPLCNLIAIAGGFIFVSLVAISLTIWGLRADAIDNAYLNSGNIAQVLSEQISRSIQSVDIVLTDVRDRLGAQTLSGTDFSKEIRSQEMFHFLKGRLAQLSQADFIALVDKDGQLATTTRVWPAPITDLSDRMYFQKFKNNADRGLYISQLLFNRVSGSRFLFFSKRVSGANNEFLGVVMIGIRLDYFEGIYNSFAHLGHQSFLLAKRDGTILVRRPDMIRGANARMPSTSPWYKLVDRGGYYRSPGYFDGTARYVAVRPLQEYPLVVDVALSEDFALAKWYKWAILIGLGTAFALLCSLFLLYRLTKQFRSLVESEGELAKREGALAEKTKELQVANLQIDTALHNMSQGLCMFDSDGVLVICNERYLAMYGLSAEETKPGCTLREVLEHRVKHGTFATDPVSYAANILNLSRSGETISYPVELGDGRIVQVTNRPMTGGSGWVATHEDITERKRAEARIEHLAHHDALTGLPNRTAFNEYFAKALEQSEASGEPFALMCLDLDRFKHVNDIFGHTFGDALLREVATRLKNAAGDAFLARVGGDEFSLILMDKDLASKASYVAQRITASLGGCLELDGRKVSTNVSVGVAIYPTDANDGQMLVCNADAALYRAKVNGPGSYKFFEPEMDRQLRQKRELQHDLRSALQEKELRVVYQPEALIDGTVIGFEALARWHHPVRGLVPPSTFIPLAEDSGLIIPLGEWILRSACREAASWKSQGQLAVNLSPAQFRHGDLPNLVHKILLETGLQPSRLELEITEGLLIDDFGRVQAILRRLKSLGVKIALDDFGTGYSSLSYLHSFPFDKVKIDRSFISDIETNRSNAAIVKAVINLAQSLNLPVIAEGVETETQRSLLRDQGCDQIQGYLIGKPLPIEEYVTLTNSGAVNLGSSSSERADVAQSKITKITTSRKQHRQKSVR